MNVSGIFHFSANERMTKYDMCKKLCKIGHISETGHLVPDSKAPLPTVVQRPRDVQLIVDSLYRKLGIQHQCISFEDFFQSR